MNHKRHTKVTQDNSTQGDIIEVTAQAFADSRIPDMLKRYGKDYIPFGEKNDYPDYLLMLYNKSAKHNAIINGKVVYITGNGLDSEDEAAKEWLKKANESQSWDVLVKSMTLDIENFGGCYLQVIPKLGGGYNYYHVAYERLRSNEDNTKFYYNPKWDTTYNGQQPEAEYPQFYPGIGTTSIFYYKEYRCGKNPYALPGWVAACNWVESDIEVSKHTLTNAKSGFSASKFINFFNGEPAEEKKKSIERRLMNAVTGSEGKKLMIGYNNDPAKKPTIDDLGESDLTKEDFTQVDNLITNNIFSGHNITHPLLFGIQQEGKLGNATELKTAYEIFKNTYVNNKQNNNCEIVKYFASISGIQAEFRVKPVEPVGLELDPVQFKEMLPKAWVLEKLGIDLDKYEPADAVATTTEAMGNEALVKLSGRQQQNLLRIVRLFTQGKLTKQQAAIQLAAYNFTPAQIDEYLGVNAEFSEQDYENDIASMFEEFGEDRQQFEVLSSENYTGEENMRLEFVTLQDLTNNEKNVLELLKKQPDLKPDQVAEALKIEVQTVTSILDRMAKSGVISYDKKGVRINERLPKQTLPDIRVMYTYEKRRDVAGPTLLPTSRPFCQRMVKLSETKMISRENIQKMSEILGYSVFKRAGGFWNNNGKIEYQCRHGWMKHVIITKAK